MNPGVQLTLVDFRTTKPTVVFADDDPATLTVAADALGAAGFKVIKVADGQQALQEALSRKVDLVFLDVSIPQVDGVEACHCLKAMPKTAKIPVVLMAAKKDPVVRSLGERMNGCAHFLRKPFTPEELVEAAKKSVRQRSLL